MIVNELTKLKVIGIIDQLKPKFTGTIYSGELRAIRNKYIYKDIEKNEFKNDLIKLKNYNAIKKNTHK